MGSLSDAFDLIDLHGELADFHGPQSDQLIAVAEAALGTTITGAYREFVKRYGAGGFGAEEIYGVFSSSFAPGPPEMVGTTLDSRRSGLPNDMLIISLIGDGTVLALDQRQHTDDPPVLRGIVGQDVDTWDAEFETFADFLFTVITEEVEEG